MAVRAADRVGEVIAADAREIDHLRAAIDRLAPALTAVNLDLKAGDKVTFEVHPLKDGRKGGFMVSAKLADGSVLYNLPRRPEK